MRARVPRTEGSEQLAAVARYSSRSSTLFFERRMDEQESEVGKPRQVHYFARCLPIIGTSCSTYGSSHLPNYRVDQILPLFFVFCKKKSCVFTIVSRGILFVGGRSIDRSIVKSLDPIEGRDNDFDVACKLD